MRIIIFFVIFVLLINTIYANSFTIKHPARCNSLLWDSVDKPSCRIFDFMKLIPLSAKKPCKNKGKYFAQVDDEDYNELIKYHWSVCLCKGGPYATLSTAKGKIKMHRLIMQVNDPNILIDHKDRDGLNNKKNNLRVATHKQNQINTTSRKGSTSKYLGVCLPTGTTRWKAGIRVSGKWVHLGYFGSESDAARAYDSAAKKYHKEFANLNFK